MIRFFKFILPALPKILFYNFKLFPVNIAIKLPLFISYDSILIAPRRSINILNPEIFCFKLGYVNEVVDPYKSGRTFFKVHGGGKVLLRGTAQFAKASTIIINGGRFELGDKFAAGAGLQISCRDKITIGNDCLLSRNITIRDNDSHKINGKINMANVEIGNHCWIGEYVYFLKNTCIADNVVVGARTTVTRKYCQTNIIIAKNPDEIVKTDVVWEN